MSIHVIKPFHLRAVDTVLAGTHDFSACLKETMISRFSQLFETKLQRPNSDIYWSKFMSRTHESSVLLFCNILAVTSTLMKVLKF
mmetsp:Transcript_7597/g.13714  ORF Transcript_7597/g.13714 Transcript_7597/m.13714 type:complete len:85 (+) Transcript_7597:619-873(+)